MNCNAWEVDNATCVCQMHIAMGISNPLSPRSESAGYYIRYSQRTFDLTVMINCIFLLLCCVVSLHLASIERKTDHQNQTGWKPPCRFPDSRFDSPKLIGDWITCFHYHHNIIQTCCKGEGNNQSLDDEGSWGVQNPQLEIPWMVSWSVIDSDSIFRFDCRSFKDFLFSPSFWHSLSDLSVVQYQNFHVLAVRCLNIILYPDSSDIPVPDKPAIFPSSRQTTLLCCLRGDFDERDEVY